MDFITDGYGYFLNRMDRYKNGVDISILHTRGYKHEAQSGKGQYSPII